MLKLCGGALVLAASAGMAYSIRRELQAHLELLYEIRRMLLSVSYGVIEQAQPIGLVLAQPLRIRDERLKAACREVARRLSEKQTGQGEVIWREVFGSCRSEWGLKEEEAEILLDAGSAYFGVCMAENKKQLDLALERLAYVIQDVRGERKTKQKVYQTLCIACGLMCLIVLI